MIITVPGTIFQLIMRLIRGWKTAIASRRSLRPRHIFSLLALCRLMLFQKDQDAPITIINGGAFHNLSRIAIADFYQTLARTLRGRVHLKFRTTKLRNWENIGQRVHESFLQGSYWFSEVMVMPGEARGEDLGMKACGMDASWAASGRPPVRCLPLT